MRTEGIQHASRTTQQGFEEHRKRRLLLFLYLTWGALSSCAETAGLRGAHNKITQSKIPTVAERLSLPLSLCVSLSRSPSHSLSAQRVLMWETGWREAPAAIHAARSPWQSSRAGESGSGSQGR